MADYITAAQIKALVPITQTTWDTVLAQIATGVSRAIDNACNRPDGFIAVSVASARVYAGKGESFFYLGNDEFIAVTKVEVKSSPTDTSYVEWDASDYLPFSGEPDNPDFNSLPYQGIMISGDGDRAVFTDGAIGKVKVPTVRVTAKWGYAASVPEPIYNAAGMQALRWWKRYQSSMADAAASAEFGQLLYRQRLDPDIRTILEGRYIRPSY